MHLTRNDYRVKEYFYKNYVNLDRDEIAMVLEWRNNIEIRKWMVSDTVISYDDHCKFVESLKDRADVYYWLVFKDGMPVGTFNISHIDNSDNSVETGYFLNPKFLNSGEGLFFQNNYKMFLYDILNVDLIVGSVLWGNTRTLQMSLFFGSEVISSYYKDDKHYLQLNTRKERYNLISQKSLIKQFIRYCKDNPIDWTKFNNHNE